MSDVTIPEDVMKAAQAAAKEAAMRSLKTGELNPELVIARAILAERERAAKVAEAVAQECRDFAQKAQRRQQKMASSAQAFVADRIAKAIRSSHE